MPFGELAPKSECGCKNRTCPLQDNLINVSTKQGYLRYRCSKPELWAVCLRWVDPKSHTTKEAELPKQPEPVKPKPAEMYPIHNHTSDEPCTPTCPNFREKNRCSLYPSECAVCSPNQKEKCGVPQ